MAATLDIIGKKMRI